MTAPHFSESDFQAIGKVMHDTIGLSFNDAKKSLIASRLTPRLQKLGLRSFKEYVDILLLDSEPAEFQMAVDLLTTNETYFFREPKHYALLEVELTASKNKTSWSIWSAAASFGDEAYSVAMLLSDMQTMGKIGPQWSILATDVSHRVLLSAKEAIFPQDRLREVSVERLRRYCLRGTGPNDGQILLQDKIRKRVQFGQLNLCKPFDGIGPFDVIFLRNVLIYFDQATKQEVIERVLDKLKQGGLLFLGTAEGRINSKTPLRFLQPGVFRKL